MAKKTMRSGICWVAPFASPNCAWAAPPRGGNQAVAPDATGDAPDAPGRAPDAQTRPNPAHAKDRRNLVGVKVTWGGPGGVCVEKRNAIKDFHWRPTP